MSLARDVYGPNMGRGQARRMISRGHVRTPRATANPKVVATHGWCSYAGQQWSISHPVSCDCACHFETDAACDLAFGRGNRCDGTKVRP